MEIEFIGKALEDIVFWKESGNKNIQKRITRLLESISMTPYDGIGKPEPLKHEFAGYWSRRIDEEHRIVYMVKDERVKVISMRFHYK